METMTPKPQANTLDEILETYGQECYMFGQNPEEWGSRPDSPKQQLLAEVLDMIGEDKPEQDGWNSEAREQNRLRRELRKAAKERFK